MNRPLLVIAALLGSIPLARAQGYCECIDGILYCYEDPAPSYDHAPVYEAQRPSYYYPYDGSPQKTQRSTPSYSSHTSSANADLPPAVPAEIVLLALVGLVAAVIAAACSSSESAIDDDVEQTRALTKKLEDAAREADERIAAYLDKMRSGGDG